MDPNNLQLTNFCNLKINNIISNEVKSYILQELKLRVNGMTYNTNYAKILSKINKQGLNNPHIACLKSNGSPYLMYCCKINLINYVLFIDKKINNGYSYPKIFILPIYFTDDVFNGTLFECELVKDKYSNWHILFIDVYYHNNVLLNNKNIINRINLMYEILKNAKLEEEVNYFIKVKEYFNLKNLKINIKNTCNKLNYNHRGIYFIPLNVKYNKLLYLFDKNELKSILDIKDNNLNFLVTKTHNVEIYDIYLIEKNNYKKIDILYIPNIDKSKYVKELFDKYDKEIIVKCIYNYKFNKWEPIEYTEESVNNINDLNI